MNRLEAIKLMLIVEQPFFGYLLMHIAFKRDDSIDNIGTDGEKIYFKEEFVKNANDDELKFLIMHQILHMVLNHIIRSFNYIDEATFSKATDLIVNSIILEALTSQQISNLKKISIEHEINGNRASEYTADQIYHMIKKENEKSASNNSSESIFNDDDFETCSDENMKRNGDDHSIWKKLKGKSKFELGKLTNKWSLYIKDASNFATKMNGNMPGSLKRIIKYIERNKVEWKDALRNFVDTEITDYSFNPPDKRYSSDSFLLPDFNETEDKVIGVFFFIDVSGSMSDDQIAECKAELRACIQQYNEKIEGYLGYFDYNVSNLNRFDDEDSMENIDFLGGGGTSFENIFKFLDEHDDEYEVEKKKVIIMTDGFAPFPNEQSLNVDEVLWIINNDEVTPPFGEVVRI